MCVCVCVCVSTVVFIVGSRMYTKVAPKGNIMLEVCKCIWVSCGPEPRLKHTERGGIQSSISKTGSRSDVLLSVFCLVKYAVKNRFRNRSSSIPKREHWMDWADEKYEVRAQHIYLPVHTYLYIPL